METILASSIAAFIVLTVIVFGACAFLTGQTLAEGWKPESTLYGYIVLLGLGDRFLVYGLFGGPLLSLHGFVVHTAFIAVIAVVTFRMARARRMVSQYPWLYERSGPFGWRERPGGRLAE
ncbi:hypothetical protein HL658_04025 [Azospirillum sp. RWY-5-1]|uniref:DUF6867 domain-containing protein n=1 Tax=Azospirillum oleiclasticum TaxID=2735135 RepID=A0ABX2T451_9PROT|nr:hypothetical protein [Azospirillum oleiclasticum]NYZ11706.1 hypothetical protein [Azospirillum oleiclasticum]NYZ18867.1 hypothetical protein [Azospirillum oleiclasticum]